MSFSRRPAPSCFSRPAGTSLPRRMTRGAATGRTSTCRTQRPTISAGVTVYSRQRSGHRLAPLRDDFLVPVSDLTPAIFVRAVSAAVHRAADLRSVADDARSAFGTGRRQGMDGAFKTVERPGSAAHRHGEGFVVVIAADVASRH